jgi:hypothetical protein
MGEIFGNPLLWVVGGAVALVVMGAFLMLTAERRRGAGAIGAAEARVQELTAERDAAVLKAQQLEEAAVSAERASGSARSSLIHSEIVHFLSLLQNRGRFIDFLMDDVARYDDQQVGAAARVVHQGCASVLKEYFDIVPVQGEEEGTSITLGPDYNPGQYRLVGKVVGRPPFQGTLLHRGWRTRKVTLPHLATDLPDTAVREVIAPAEVELR